MYYVGETFDKEKNKEYKTIQNAFKTAAKDEKLKVFEEDGAFIASLTDAIPDGAALKDDAGQQETKENEQDNGKNEQEEGHNASGSPEMTNTPENTKGVNEANGASDTGHQEDAEEENGETIVPQETMTVTVICEGTLNLRRSASWKAGNECGRAAKGQTYYVKAIREVAGRKMVETIDGLFLSGQREHVKIDEIE